MTRGSVTTDSCEITDCLEYIVGMVLTACAVLKNERPTGRLDE
jgi:hypothetical protein